MNKIKIFTLFVICGLSFVICTAMPCFADVKATVSSGGTVSPAFIDLKGEPVIGESVQNGVKVQLGALYTYGPDIILGDWPYGTVPLTIERVGKDIKISWPPTIVNPTIYVLVGGGTGVFTHTYDPAKWSPAAAGFDLTTIGNSYILHQDQVGEGAKDPEAYYKGLQASVTPATTDPANGKLCIEQAWAVGKADYSFGVGNNYFCYPFIGQTEVNLVFGSSGYADSCKVQKHDRATDGFVGSGFNLAGKTWNNSFLMEEGKGYVFFNNGVTTLPVTLVGSIDPKAAAFSLPVLAGNNYIGLPVPSNIDLIRSFAAKPIMNDKVQMHDRTTDGFIGNRFTGANFEDPNQRLNPFIGYVYLRDAGQFDWTPQQ